jgi:hypothetical protein
MRLGLNTLATFLKSFGGRKRWVLSGLDGTSSDSTHRPNIFAHRAISIGKTPPRAQQDFAKTGPSPMRPPTAQIGPPRLLALGTAHGETAWHQYGRAKIRPLADWKPLQRCNTVLVRRPPRTRSHRGTFVAEPSFVVPGFPEPDYRHLPPFVVQKLRFDALHEGRQAALRAEKE